MVRRNRTLCLLASLAVAGCASMLILRDPRVPAGTSKAIVSRTLSELKLKWISAGQFTMGSPNTEMYRYDQETQHEVKLTKGYNVGETHVTVG